MLKPPVSLALTVRVSPLSICLAVTVTPGNTAPVESRTTPEMAPEKPCPHTNELAHTITPRICTNVVAHLVKLLSLFTISPLSVLRCDTKFAGTPGSQAWIPAGRRNTRQISRAEVEDSAKRTNPVVQSLAKCRYRIRSGPKIVQQEIQEKNVVLMIVEGYAGFRNSSRNRARIGFECRKSPS